VRPVRARGGHGADGGAGMAADPGAQADPQGAHLHPLAAVLRAVPGHPVLRLAGPVRLYLSELLTGRALCMDKRQKTPVPANTGGAPGQKRGAAFARGAARRCVWAVRLALGAALFAPIVLFMMAFNYTVDCSGMFQ